MKDKDNNYPIKRMSICNKCEYLLPYVKVCKICKCVMPLKVRFEKESCPKKNGSVLTLSN